MKVLQICAYSARYGGNFIASLSVLEQQLSAKGIQTEYLFPEIAREMPWCQELQKRTTVYFASLNRFSLKTYSEVARAMAEADVVHSHFELYDCLTVLAKKRQQKLFWHLHDSFEEHIDFPHRVINKIQYGFLGKRAMLISPSAYYADYVTRLGFPKQQIFHVANCIDFDRLHREAPKQQIYDFLIFGGFYYIKGLDVLLDSCRILLQRGFRFRVAIVGYEDTWRFIQNQYSELLPYICQLEPSENVSQFYLNSGTFLSTSRRECFSYALLEALYMGMPAIISDIPGNAWAGEYASTLVVPGENAQALADAMQLRITGSPWFKEEDLHDTARDVAARYSADQWAQRIEEIYIDG